MKFDIFKSKSLENQKVEKKKNEESEGKLSRRDLFKLGIGAGGAFLAGGTVYKAVEWLGEEDEERPFIPTKEQERITEEDIKSINEILRFDEDIKLDLEQTERIKRNWKKRYTEEPELRDSLIKGYKEIGAWEEYLREIFKNEGVPEEFIYLAIPESHWDPKAVSRAGAKGPYQFMGATARSMGLSTGTLDERKDPLKSGRACARLLKDLYDRCGDWDLALSGYNGGFFWKYLKQAKKEEQDYSYEGFLKYIESKVNDIKEKAKGSSVVYEVEKGDNLTKIANKFGVNIEAIMRNNNIDDANKIKPGMRLRFPQSQEQQEKEFKKGIRGFSENLNYPAKYNAIMELINENFVNEQKEKVEFDVAEVQQAPSQVHIFKKSDKTLSNLARSYKDVTVQDILGINPKIKPRKLKGGEKIKIPHRPQIYIFQRSDKTLSNLASKNRGISTKDIMNANPGIDPTKLRGGEKIIIPPPKVVTLESIAKKRNVSIERLKYLNPSVEKTDAAIPDCFEIRI